MRSRRKVLVVGTGGREHALALRLAASESVAEVLVAPGNAGTARGARGHEAAVRNVDGSPLEVVARERPDLVVVGPEAPLCDGLADRISDLGVPCYGPSARAARLEGSKAFMKELVRRHGVPTAEFHVVRDVDAARAYIDACPEPPVVKADGLCAGKGVVVADTKGEALAAATSMLSGEAFGEAGRTVVLEQRLAGAEASVHAICDGERAWLLPVAQDHKRIGDGDRGPNTGGMGTYAPAPVVDDALLARVEREVVAKVLFGMAAEGSPFRGTLFAGLMIAPDGEPQLLEINVRFGDPETQVLMALLDGDLAEALDGAARGRLVEDALRISPRHAVCVVLAAAGYPGAPRRGDEIRGLEEAERIQGVRVHHAGTAVAGDRIVTAGGRVLGVTAVDDGLRGARERAYAAVGAIRFDGMQYRTDIGARAI